MKRDIAERWTAALRSGKFAQTQGALHTSHGYCCLGVLCELAVEDGVVRDRTISHFGAGQWEVSYDTASGLLPHSVMAWADIKDCGGAFDNHQALSSLNDHGHDFDEIADVIEEHVDVL